MNDYARRLQEIKAKQFHDQKEIGDQWRTTDNMLHGIETLLPEEDGTKPRFVLDLFTDGQNAKCPDYFTAENNALLQDWGASLDLLFDGDAIPYAFANPPYSISQSDDGDFITGMAPIMAKVMEEREKGARMAFLIKAATSETWWPDNLPDRTIFIKGRISFEKPVWFRQDPAKKAAKNSAFFGCAVLIFNKYLKPNKEPLYIHRKEIEKLGQPFADAMAERRRQHIENFEL